MRPLHVVTVLSLCVLFVLVVPAVHAAGLFEKDESRSEPQGQPAESVVDSNEPVDIPDWVRAITENDYDLLYPGEEGGGYIGIGIGSSREEALAAAAVDFAGNVSTEVDASVTERGEASSDGEESFDVVIESEVRSQAIVSGLEPRIWKDPQTSLVYALYSTTVDEYAQRLKDWTETMESISEAERRREIQRLEDARAAAERRREEIKLEELKEQVRLADRRMRADRHRTFLYMQIPARERGVPTPYLPEKAEVNAGYRGGFKESGIDLGYDRSFWTVFNLGMDVEGVRRSGDEHDMYGAGTARIGVRLLDRVGWVTSTSLVAGVYGGGNLDDAFEPDWAVGPYLAADLLLPELAHTRYGVYAGTDLVHGRVAWYPFWRSIEDAVSLHVAAQYTWWEYGATLEPSNDRDYVGASLVFRPAEGFWISVDSRNISSLRGSITVAY